MILGGQSVGKDLHSGINPRILPQGDEAAAYKHTLDMSFFRFTSVYVACECRCISGRPFSPSGSKKSDDRKYVCVDRLRCKNLGTFFFASHLLWVFGSTVLTSLFYVTREFSRFLHRG